MIQASILVHGGVGQVPEHELPQRLASLQAATELAKSLLEQGDSALDAAVAAVVAMENAPLLNAGYDCCLNLEGQAEHDASVMDSAGLGAGIGAVVGVQNPILLARLIAERTEHRLMVAEGAASLARKFGLPFSSAITPRTQKRHAELLQALRERPQELEGKLAWKRLREFLDQPELHSTVGAVARDASGGLAAATSTGGIWLKLPGRVGDSAILGAGTYCSPMGAASATGYGEGILKLGLCRKAVDLLARPNTDCTDAASEVVAEATANGVDCGLILVDAQGNFAAKHNCRHMPGSFWHSGGLVVTTT